MFPQQIASFVQNPWMQSISDALHPGDWRYNVLYVGLIVFFCYFYTAVTFNPVDVADNMRKYGGFIPGIRPGKATAAYIDKVLTRITFGGAIYVSAVCVLPTILSAQPGRAVPVRRHRADDRGRRGAGHRPADRVAPHHAQLRRASPGPRGRAFAGVPHGSRGRSAPEVGTARKLAGPTVGRCQRAYVEQHGKEAPVVRASGSGQGDSLPKAGGRSRNSPPGHRATCSGEPSPKGTALGQRAAAHMTGGALVPDEVAVAVLEQRLASPDDARGLSAGRLSAHPRPGARCSERQRLVAGGHPRRRRGAGAGRAGGGAGRAADRPADLRAPAGRPSTGPPIRPGSTARATPAAAGW